MEGLIEEGSEIMEEDFEGALLDAALIGADQRVDGDCEEKRTVFSARISFQGPEGMPAQKILRDRPEG